MRRGRILPGLAATLAAGLGLSAAVLADPGSPPPPGSTSVFSQMMGRRVAPIQASSSTSRKPADKKPAKAPPRPAEDPVAKARAHEMANWLRRQEICLKLMQVAEATNDEALLRKAQELDQRSSNAYQRRMAELSGAASDEDALSKELDAKKSPRSSSAGVFPFFRGGARASSAPREETPQ